MAGQRGATACVLGLGGMGSAMALRLRATGHSVQVWNRTAAKAAAVAAAEAPGPCAAASTPAAAIMAAGSPAPVIVVLTDTAAVVSMLRVEGVGAALRGRALVNLTSGNPDDGREVARVAMEVSLGEASVIDGAYCGNPSKVRDGAGQVFLSSDSEEAVRQVRPLLEQLGSVAFCGGLGSSRALDYAVVDLFFASLLSFMSNKEALDREGVDIKQLCEEMKKRLDTVPAALDMYNARMASRKEEDYKANTTVTLQTSRSYWASRLPYNEARGIPSHLTHLFLDLLDEAAGGKGGPHSEADVSRLQEVVCHGSAAASRSSTAGESAAAPPPSREQAES